MKEEIITVEEFCELFGFKRNYVYKMIYEKRIPHYKPYGKKVFFKMSEIMDNFNKTKVITG